MVKYAMLVHNIGLSVIERSISPIQWGCYEAKIKQSECIEKGHECSWPICVMALQSCVTGF